jgi:hypothetical protein
MSTPKPTIAASSKPKDLSPDAVPVASQSGQGIRLEEDRDLSPIRLVKPTEGPYRAESYDNHSRLLIIGPRQGASSEIIARMPGEYREQDAVWPKVKANARLLAASWTMLDALKNDALTLLHASYLDHEGTANGDVIFAGLEKVRKAIREAGADDSLASVRSGDSEPAPGLDETPDEVAISEQAIDFDPARVNDLLLASLKHYLNSDHGIRPVDPLNPQMDPSYMAVINAIALAEGRPGVPDEILHPRL